MLRTLGHYRIPLNFGWEWQDPATIGVPVGDEYDFWTNLWVLSWNTLLAVYQVTVGACNMLFIPIAIFNIIELNGGKTYADSISNAWSSFWGYGNGENTWWKGILLMFGLTDILDFFEEIDGYIKQIDDLALKAAFLDATL